MKTNKTIIAILFLVILHFTLLASVFLNGSEAIKYLPIVIFADCFIVGFFHKQIDARFAAYALIVYVSSFVLQAIGVRSGNIFGPFFYGNSLGITVFETPLIIGLIWLLLSYSASATIGFFVSKWPVIKTSVAKALLASCLMLVVAFLIERNAATFDFWYWKNQTVPLQNYTAWFAFSFAFNFLFQKLEIDTDNKMAVWFMGLFTAFLLGLNAISLS
jgi:putative membrane protein